MSVVTGLGLAFLIMLLGALCVTIFAAYLADRGRPQRVREMPIGLARKDVQQLIALIEDLQPIRDKLQAILANGVTANKRQ